MPLRRSDNNRPAADSGADAQMRKLEASLQSLRSAARELAAQRAARNGGRLALPSIPAAASESSAAAARPARVGFLRRAAARLRALRLMWLR